MNFICKAQISKLDIHKWLPYHNRVYYTTILGSDLLQVFRESGTGITAKNNSSSKDWGQFLQVSSTHQHLKYNTYKLFLIFF